MIAAAFGVACNANVKEGCATAQCGLGGQAALGGAAATGAGQGGEGGEGGMCPSFTPGVCTPVAPAVGDFPCDVFAVLHAKCHRCHQGYDRDLMMMPQPQMGAPFPFLKYEDTQKVYGSFNIWEDMHRVILPCQGPHMPFNPPDLTPTEFNTLVTWFTGCGQPVAKGTGCGCPDGWQTSDGDAVCKLQ